MNNPSRKDKRVLGQANTLLEPGMDCLDYFGFIALHKQGLTLTDADESMEEAHISKTMDEIELMQQSATITEVALHDM